MDTKTPATADYEAPTVTDLEEGQPATVVAINQVSNPPVS
jgi:hypothetical protein